jgi:glycosyltransferase involved in cell wall biosynthesis
MRRPDQIHVVIATPRGEGGKGGVDRIMDVIRSYGRSHPDPGFAFHFLTTRGNGSILLSPAHLASAALRLIWLRAIGRADVLHVNIGKRGSALRKLVLCGLARGLRLPYVLHLHGSEFRSYWDCAGPSLSARLETAFGKAARTVVLGTVWARYIADRAPGARIEIVPNATFAPEAGPGERPPNGPVQILFLGELGPRKGVPELVEALAAVPCATAWRATLAGNGAVEETRAEVARRGLEGRVSVRGWAGPEEVERLLRGADILALPSHHENLPMSVIEGMAYGLAVIATPVGAVPDIIAPGETGLLCPPGDPAALAENLRMLVSDAALRNRLGQAARAFHREHLDAPTFVRRLKSVWTAAADGPAASVRPQPRRPALTARDRSPSET